LNASNAPDLIGDLLTATARGSLTDAVGAARPHAAAGYPPQQVQAAIDAGLGPLLERAFRQHHIQGLDLHADPLRAARLTALVRHGNDVRVAVAVIDACARLGVPVTLLKGISISEQHYPAGELRPMGDIDLLVPTSMAATVEAALKDEGFEANIDAPSPGHHGVPLYEPRQQVWVEIHTALFGHKSGLHGATLFRPQQIAAWSVASTFEGRDVMRLRDEMQLVYLACSWVRDMSLQCVQPSFVLQLFDALFLLRSSGSTLDWHGLVAMLDNEKAAASVHLLLSYLVARGWYPAAAPILPLLAARHSLLGPHDLKGMHWILDRYLLQRREDGRLAGHWQATIAFNTLNARGGSLGKWLRVPWNLVFPPSIAERYRPGFHWARVTRRWKRRT
jgi:Uncharacterised nucleotidyltransferase